MSMKLFIWRNLRQVTDRYHDDGGVVVVAETLQAARALIPRVVRDGDTEMAIGAPDAEYELRGSDTPRAFVFPDSGCC